ncbi:MAG: hypothetical protein QFF03_22740 [Pseudomonadota bacterium]|nr:hypothetical protein [Pseudomonadota bacterium]
MISEFQDLSDKIDRLAELTASLRRENAALRQASAILSTENSAYKGLLAEAQRRVAALLEQLPPAAADVVTTTTATTIDDEARS